MGYCGRQSSMQASTSAHHAARHRFAARWLITAFALAVALSACSGKSSSDSSESNAAAGVAGVGTAPSGRASMADNMLAPVLDKPSETPAVDGVALIKTAAVTLHSGDISSVIAKVDELVAGIGGQITSEDTSTNSAGVEVRTRIVLSVPVADFDRSVDELSLLGDLVSKSRSSQDVTSRLVDVNSRVISAKDSIAQLRTLFKRATKLKDVIALERELSAREADLEALQSQQRSLVGRTAMSTITVNVTRPDEATAQADAGFVSGLKQGWHSLVAFVVAFTHGLGLVLPLGTLALCVGAVGYLLIRRLRPRREAVPGTSD